jgi:probable HAF family extracellular repeat protein
VRALFRVPEPVIEYSFCSSRYSEHSSDQVLSESNRAPRIPTQEELDMRKIMSVCTLSFLALLAPAASAQDYTVIDLGTLGGKSSGAFAINANGQITGTARTAAGHQHAFLYQNGTMQDLGTLGGKSSAGLAINIKGQITGYANTADEIQHAFMYDGSMTDLGTLNGYSSRGTGINDAGQITGWTDVESFVYSAGAMSQIPNVAGFPESRVVSSAINDSGQVTGIMLEIFDNYIYDEQPILFDGTTTKFLGSTEVDHDSQPAAINDAGVIAGEGVLNGNYAVMRTNGHFKNLGVPAGYARSAAFGMNAVSEVVGDTYKTAPGPEHAMFYNSLLGMLDLNTSINSNSGWTLKSARGINVHGQIVGEGVIQGHKHGYLLKPNALGILRKYIFQLAIGIEGCIQCKTALDNIDRVLPPDATGLTAAQRRQAIQEINVLNNLVTKYADAGIVSKPNALLVRNEAGEALRDLSATKTGTTGAD